MASDSDTRLDEVRELAAQRRYDQALRGYRTLCQRDPYDPDLWLEHAAVAEAAGRIDDATDALLHVVELYADTGMAEAIDVAERVLEIDPEHAEARRFLEIYAPERQPPGPPGAPGARPRTAPGAWGRARSAPVVDEDAGEPALATTPALTAAARSQTAPLAGVDPVPEPIWDAVPMIMPASTSIPVAVPILDSVPMPMPASDSMAMPRPRANTASGPIALPPELAAFGDLDELVTLDGSGVPRAPRANVLTRTGGHRAAAHMIAALRSSPLLDVLDQAALDFALETGHVRHFERGASVVRQGDRGDSLFLVLEGSVDVERYHPVLGTVVRLSTLPAGAFFGEHSLVAGVARSATVRARRQTSALELGRDTVRALGRMNDQVLVALMRFFRARLIGTVMATSPLFHPFSADERRAMVSRLRLRELPAQEIVMRQGRVGDGLYVVLIGTLVAFADDDRGRARRLGVLGPGDIFGEMSLIRGEPAMASIGTHTRSWILRLPREDFDEVVAAHPEVLDQLADIAAVRNARNRDILARNER
jgi:CRP-like cAMP-binding protein